MSLSHRCPQVKPNTDEIIQCIHTASTSHKIHSGWLGDVRHEWNEMPKGPQSHDEYAAAAWELSASLGLEMYHDKIYDRIVVDRHALGEWWDGADQSAITEAYRDHGAKK